MVPTTLLIIRGMPGSGKTTLGKLVSDVMFSADDYFTHNGVYTFDSTKLPEAHEWCKKNVRESLVLALGGNHRKKVAVANTFSEHWEFLPYVFMAQELDVQFFVIDLFTQDLDYKQLQARCVHDVPDHTLLRMFDRWQH